MSCRGEKIVAFSCCRRKKGRTADEDEGGGGVSRSPAIINASTATSYAHTYSHTCVESLLEAVAEAGLLGRERECSRGVLDQERTYPGGGQPVREGKYELSISGYVWTSGARARVRVRVCVCVWGGEGGGGLLCVCTSFRTIHVTPWRAA